MCQQPRHDVSDHGGLEEGTGRLVIMSWKECSLLSLFACVYESAALSVCFSSCKEGTVRVYL